MFTSLVPVNRERHGQKAIRAIDSFDFAKGFHLASLMVHEFSRAASVYPIVFIEDPKTGDFNPIVMLGIDEGENLFVGQDGKWQSSYIPAIIRRYPFALARVESVEDQFTVCLDEASSLVVDADDTHTNRLFDEAGEPTQVIERVKQYLSELQQMEVFTKAFCQFLASHNLFTPLNLRVRQGQALKQITGCYVVNEARLNSLGNDAYLAMREKRYTGPLYAHLTSLGQIERLSMLKDGVLALSPSEVEAKEAAKEESESETAKATAKTGAKAPAKDSKKVH